MAAEQGEVRVTPTNTSLAPFTLKGRQMADVSAADVSPVTSLRNAGEPAGDRGGSLFGDNLLWVGVGIGGLLVLVLLSLLVFLIYRLLNPKPVQLVSQPSAKRANPTPGVAAQMRRCPHPRCGKMVRSNKKFCSACGRSLL